MGGGATAGAVTKPSAATATSGFDDFGGAGGADEWGLGEFASSAAAPAPKAVDQGAVRRAVLDSLGDLYAQSVPPPSPPQPPPPPQQQQQPFGAPPASFTSQQQPFGAPFSTAQQQGSYGPPPQQLPQNFGATQPFGAPHSLGYHPAHAGPGGPAPLYGSNSAAAPAYGAPPFGASLGVPPAPAIQPSSSSGNSAAFASADPFASFETGMSGALGNLSAAYAQPVATAPAFSPPTRAMPPKPTPFDTPKAIVNPFEFASPDATVPSFAATKAPAINPFDEF